MDKLLNDNGGLTELGQLDVFNEHRSKVESIASQKYDCAYVEDGVIIVRPEDVEKAGLAGPSKAG